MLDIIVTHFDEPWEVGKPLFDMIGMQRGIDFHDIRVILVNDGPEYALTEDVFIDYPYHVDVITIPHGGVSAARNAGMDYATAEWINFCDFDDTYTNIYALRDILMILPAPKYDFLWAKMITEDLVDGNNVLYVTPNKSNFVFIHSKYYRRSYLIKNNLRFDTELDYNEDSEFNGVILAILDYKRIGEIKTMFPPYSWKRRNGSVTNRENVCDPANYGHFKRNIKICQLYVENLSEDRIQAMVVRSVYDAYYMIESQKLTNGMREKIRKEFVDFMKSGYEKWYAEPPEDILIQIDEVSRLELMDHDRPVPNDFKSITNWYHRQMNMYKSKESKNG